MLMGYKYLCVCNGNSDNSEYISNDDSRKLIYLQKITSEGVAELVAATVTRVPQQLRSIIAHLVVESLINGLDSVIDRKHRFK